MTASRDGLPERRNGSKGPPLPPEADGSQRPDSGGDDKSTDPARGEPEPDDQRRRAPDQTDLDLPDDGWEPV